MLMFEALGPRPEMAGDFARLHQPPQGAGGEWIARGIEAGEVRADVDPQAAAVTVIGALGGIAYQYLLDPRGIDLDRSTRSCEFPGEGPACLSRRHGRVYIS